MDKIKLLTFSVIALLFLNLATLGYLFLSGGKASRIDGHDRHMGKPMPREIIIMKLNFDDNQIAEYDKTIKTHQKNIADLDSSIRETKNELYQELKSESANNQKKDSLISAISTYQSQIETTHFNHFLEIKKICRPDQLDKYMELTDELSKIFSHPPRPKR